MQELFRKAFGIYSGEGAHALRFARLSLFWAFGSICFDTLSDGFFLERIGAGLLPRAYLAIALGMVAVASLILYSLKVTSPYRILIVAMALSGAASLAASFCIGAAPPDWFWYAMKIASRMFFLVLIPCSWTFIDQYHDLQDAKRVYALYNSAYFVGVILSGIAINTLLDTIGFSGLLLCATTSMLLGINEARGIALKAKAVHDDTSEGVFSGSRGASGSAFRMIWRSRFALVLLSFSLLLQLLMTTTEFNYMNTFGSAFASSGELAEGKIAEFLGTCRAILSVFGLGISMFLYSRFIRRAGLHNAVLVTPLFFFLVYFGWLFHNGMGIALMGLIAVEGVLYTIDDNCFNLFSNAVSSRLRSKVRIINGSFFEPIGMLISALLLFSVQNESLWLGFSLSLVAVLLAITLRSTYPKAILNNLQENALHFERKLKGWLALMTRREQKETKREILEALRSPSSETQLLAVESLLELADPSVLSEILLAARRFGTVSKIHLLRLLDNSPFSTHSQVIEAIDQWIYESDSPELSKWANFYLAKRGLHHPEKVEDDLDHSDLFLRGAAILTMNKSLANQSQGVAALNRTIAAKKLDLMLKSSHIDEISMALDILGEEGNPLATERALPFLSHESTLVKRSAARAIARLIDRTMSRHAPRLIEELEEARDNFLRLSLLDALGKTADSTTVKDLLLAAIHFRPNERRKTEEIIIRLGLKIVPLLLTFTKDTSLTERARILSGKILGKLALPQLQANLPDILGIEIERAYFYFYLGHTIQNKYPLFDLGMLQNALHTGYQSVIDFVIHLLGAAGSLEEPELLVRSLRSRNEKIHSHAVESLEKTCDAKVFRLIAPLIDDLPLEEKMAACLKNSPELPDLTLNDILFRLDDSSSLFDKIVAVRLKAKLQTPNWRHELRELMKHSDETFHQYAYELLET